MYQSMRSLAGRVLRLLDDKRSEAPEVVQVLDLRDEINARFENVLDKTIAATRIRVHGDYHLGQVLYTGRDFMIIDFEGEPARPLTERKIKRPALRDVAGMIRSFHYAAYTPVFSDQNADPAERFEWARAWYEWVSAAFLGEYLDAADGASFVPATSGELGVLLDALLLEKAVYELLYEANNRPEWLKIPLLGVTQLVEAL
jgi:maltose alpha-D-glucosyltransferase/alpha-amylase